MQYWYRWIDLIALRLYFNFSCLYCCFSTEIFTSLANPQAMGDCLGTPGAAGLLAIFKISHALFPSKFGINGWVLMCWFL
jgi:hypothetical protein